MFYFVWRPPGLVKRVLEGLTAWFVPRSRGENSFSLHACFILFCFVLGSVAFFGAVPGSAEKAVDRLEAGRVGFGDFVFLL